jgi:hypothetical protein
VSEGKDNLYPGTIEPELLNLFKKPLSLRKQAQLLSENIGTLPG